MDLTGLQDFPLSEVNITDNYCENAFEKEDKYYCYYIINYFYNR